MRFLLLLLIAAGTALMAPYLIHEARSDIFPPGTDVMRSYQDAQEIARLLVEAWRSGQELGTSQPIFEETRVWSTFVVVAVAAQWFQGFVVGGIVGLFLMNVRTTTLFIVCGLLAFALYSCSTMQVSHDLSPETVRGIRLFTALFLAAAIAGFLTTRAFRRTTV